MEEHITTGIKEFDDMLDGGYEKGVITTIYGPPASGKTNICMLAAKAQIAAGKRVIYIDTEGSFSIKRYAQIDKDYENSLKSFLFFRPHNFEEQKKCFEQLKKLPENISVIIVDSVAMLYRLEFSKSGDTYNANRELGIQLSFLYETARKSNIPVVITNQVYSKMDETEAVNIVGGDIVKYSSKCLIEIQRFHSSKRVATLRKHRSIKEGKKVVFDIVADGIHVLESS